MESWGGIHLTMEKEEYVFPFERITAHAQIISMTPQTPATMSYLATDITQLNYNIWICVGLGHVTKPEKEVNSIQTSDA